MRITDYNRIVVKIGSSLLVNQAKGELNRAWLESLVSDLSALAKQGKELLVVSSGAIALGRVILKLPKGALKLEESQAAAAIGQIELARLWSEMLGRENLLTGQILVTLGDTEERRRYLNARNTIEKLIEFKAIAVVNENDTVATSEIRYGDNDRLAARVAGMVSSDLLILLSDIDGLFDKPPVAGNGAKLIPIIPKITAEIEQMAGVAASEFSKGGMVTKIEAAKIATAAGTVMVIASGKKLNPLRAIDETGVASWFLTASTPVTARKKWIAGQLEPKGVLTLDDGAVKALKAGKSLLPAGVTKVEGAFSRGDAVVLRSLTGDELGRGLIAYDASDAETIKGKNSKQIAEILGFTGRVEMVHRDDIAFI
jgi:glutamate 5-kinase